MVCLQVLDTLVLNFHGMRLCVSGNKLRWPARLVKVKHRALDCAQSGREFRALTRCAIVGLMHLCV